MVLRTVKETFENIKELASDFSGIGSVGPNVESRVTESEELLIQTEAVLARIDLVNGTNLALHELRDADAQSENVLFVEVS